MRGDEVDRSAASGRDVIDERIDAALRSYAEPAEVPETRVVLARVMETVQASERQRRGWWMWGAVAAAGLAAMVLVGVVWMTRSSRGPEIAWVPKAPGVTRDSENNAGAQALRLANLDAARVKSCSDAKGCSGGGEGIRRSQVRVANSLGQRSGVRRIPPKLYVFPTPRPLTDEEQALVAFARRAPPAVKKAVIEDQQHWDDPVIVADLRNPPLESGNQQHQ